MSIKPGCRMNDLAGQKIGKLLVLERAERPKTSKDKIVFGRGIGDCGKEKIVRPDG